MNTKSVASSLLTFVASILCLVLVMRPTIVSGASMMPTLHDKDVLITSPLAKQLFQPVRGDIVTLCISANPLCGLIFSGDTQYLESNDFSWGEKIGKYPYSAGFVGPD